MRINRIIRKHSTLITIVLLLLFAIQAISSSFSKSLTYDETTHLTYGYHFWKTKEYNHDIAHPPLIKKMAAFPLLFLNLNFPYDDEDCQKSYHWKCADEFLYQRNGNVDNLIFLSRLPFVLLGVLLGFFIFLWAKSLYGKKAALFSLLIYSFSPKFISHSTMVLTDLAVTCFIFINLYFLWQYTKNPSNKNIILTSITFALAQLSKFTAIYLVPIYIIMFIIKGLCEKQLKESIKKFFKLIIWALAITILLALIVYDFQFTTLQNATPSRYLTRGYNELNKIYPEGSLISNSIHSFVENIPLPFASYFSGLALQMFVSTAQEKESFLMGEIYTGGHWYYFVIEFLLKTPIPTLIFLLLTIILFKRVKNKDTLNELFLIVPLISFILVFLPNHINLGIRHILPIYPFIFVFIGKIINLKIRKQILFNIAIILLLVWYLVGTITIYPHYFAYFNEFVGGPDNGYNYLVDANLDLGQDLKGLKLYMDKNNIDKIKLSYFGSTNPSYYNIDYDYLPSPESEPWVPEEHSFRMEIPSNYTENCSKTTGLIAISATNLQNKNLINKTCFNWLKEYEPTDKIGYSIFIYNITK